MVSQVVSQGAAQVATKADYNLASPGLNTTKLFADFLARFRFEDLPERAVHEARRGLIDWLGCALAGSGHPTIDKLLAVLSAISGKPQAMVLGRKRKLGLMEAALANGQMGTSSTTTTLTWAVSCCIPA